MIYALTEATLQQNKQKKVPIRRCVGCGEGKPKKELVRVVRSANGEICLDESGKKPGRGAYICPQGSCLAKAQKRKSLQRAFEGAVPQEVYESLENALLERERQDDS